MDLDFDKLSGQCLKIANDNYDDKDFIGKLTAKVLNLVEQVSESKDSKKLLSKNARNILKAYKSRDSRQLENSRRDNFISGFNINTSRSYKAISQMGSAYNTKLVLFLVQNILDHYNQYHNTNILIPREAKRGKTALYKFMDDRYDDIFKEYFDDGTKILTGAETEEEKRLMDSVSYEL